MFKKDVQKVGDTMEKVKASHLHNTWKGVSEHQAGQKILTSNRGALQRRVSRVLNNYSGMNSRHQTVLKLNSPDDTYEREADRVANGVIRKSESEKIPERQLRSQRLSKSMSLLQEGQRGRSQASSANGEQETRLTRRNNISKGRMQVPEKLARRVDSLRGQGNPLPVYIRDFFEPAFHQDFGSVRVHTSSDSASLARQIGASAFTFGEDLFFRSGKYQPNTKTGNKLIAHELTHVIQQRRSPDEVRIQRNLEGDVDMELLQGQSKETIFANLVTIFGNLEEYPNAYEEASNLHQVLCCEEQHSLYLDFHAAFPEEEDRERVLQMLRSAMASLSPTVSIESIGEVAAEPPVAIPPYRAPTGERLIAPSDVGVDEFLRQVSETFSEQLHVGSTGRISGNHLQYQNRNYRLDPTPSLEEGQTVSSLLGEGVFLLRSISAEGMTPRTFGGKNYDVISISEGGVQETTNLRVRARGSLQTGGDILVYTARIQHLPEEVISVRPPRDIESIAGSIRETLSGAGRIVAPGVVASQVLLLLRNARVNDEELMDILQSLEATGEIGTFLQFVRFPWFRQYLRGHGIPWNYVFMHWEPNINDCGLIFSGFVIGAGESWVDIARLIAAIARGYYVWVGAAFSEELAQRRDQFFEMIFQFFENPVANTLSALREAYESFMNHIWNLEFFEAGRTLGQVGITLLTLPTAARHALRFGFSAIRASASAVMTLINSVEDFIRLMGVARDALIRLARDLTAPGLLTNEGVIVHGGDDFIVGLGRGDRAARIPRQTILQEASETRGGGARSGRGRGQGVEPSRTTTEPRQDIRTQRPGEEFGSEGPISYQSTTADVGASVSAPVGGGHGVTRRRRRGEGQPRRGREGEGASAEQAQSSTERLRLEQTRRQEAVSVEETRGGTVSAPPVRAQSGLLIERAESVGSSNLVRARQELSVLTREFRDDVMGTYSTLSESHVGRPRERINLASLDEHQRRVLGDMFNEVEDVIPERPLGEYTLLDAERARDLVVIRRAHWIRQEDSAIRALRDFSRQRQRYARIRAASPSERVRDQVLSGARDAERRRIDELTGQRPPSGELDVDHIVPLSDIVAMRHSRNPSRGFYNLDWDQQVELANFRTNLVAVDRRVNRSRGNQSWDEFQPPEGYANVAILREIRRREADMRRILQRELDRLLDATGPGSTR